MKLLSSMREHAAADVVQGNRYVPAVSFFIIKNSFNFSMPWLTSQVNYGRVNEISVVRKLFWRL